MGSLTGSVAGILLSETRTSVVAGKYNDARQMTTNGGIASMTSPFPGAVQLAYTQLDYCVSQWFKIVTAPVANILQLFTVDFYDGGGTTIGRMRAFLPGDGTIKAVTGIVAPATAAPFVIDANWHLLVATFQMSTGLLTLRVDNSVVVATTVPVVIPAGASADWFTSSQLSGTKPAWVLDEIAIFGNRTMLQADYDFLWNGGAGNFWPW